MLSDSEHFIVFKSYIQKFISLPEEEWISFKSLLYIKKYKLGEYIEENCIGLIEKGLISTIFLTDDGHEYIVEFCKENDLVTDYRFDAESVSNNYKMIALEATTLIQFNWEDFLKLCSDSPLWEKLKSDQILSFYNYKLKRERQLLSLNAEEKYKIFIKENFDLLNRVPQYQIAKYLGVTPETLSRLKKEQY